MDVLELSPGLKHNCQNCNSLLLVRITDIKAQADDLWSKHMAGWPDYQTGITCVVCQSYSSLGFLYGLPAGWRKMILANSGLTGKEREEQYARPKP